MGDEKESRKSEPQELCTVMSNEKSMKANDGKDGKADCPLVTRTSPLRLSAEGWGRLRNDPKFKIQDRSTG
jgi:hypothetical protein